MMIDRRTFVAGTASVALVPALSVLPAELPTPKIATGRLVLMIEGWSVSTESDAADAAWIRIGNSWRTAWR
jgi:hypothetical protein